MEPSQYNVPVYDSVDVLVLGGTTGAVQVALDLAEAGKRAFLVSPYTYLGEDVCAFGRYWPKSRLTLPLARSLFDDARESNVAPTPMHVKRTLERNLLDAGIPFLYTSFPTHLLRTTDESVAGCVIANRSGFQAILAPVIVDATDRAVAARMTSVEFQPWTAGFHPVRRVVVGAEPSGTQQLPTAAIESVRELPAPFVVDGRRQSAFECALTVDIPSAGPSDLARCETAARLASFSPDQVFGADRVSGVWPDRLAGSTFSLGSESEGPRGSADDVIASLACGDDRIFVLSDLGRFSPSTRESFWEPETQLELAQVLATHLVPLTSRFVDPANVSVDYGPFAPSLMSRDAGSSVDTGVEIVRRDTYFRTADRECITLDLNRFPTQGRYLVLVAGGGTAGASAGISSARAGATTLIAEYLHGLGGVGTEGRIGSYYHGNRVGFTSEVDRGTHAIGPDPWFRIEDGEWNTEWKKQWYLRASYEAGAEVWFGSLSVAAAVRGDRVTGAVIAGPYGVGLVRADATVDSTGNADVAAAAGAETVNISKAHVAVQGTGVSPFTPGKNSENTDHTFVDDTDVYDITRAFVIAREKFQDHFDLAQLIDSRQRQQVVGELSLDPLDFLAGRTFPDTITTAQSNFDSHGFTIHPLFMAKAPDKADIRAHVPFRCLIPKGLEGILITGLGVSAHRDALPVIRMQADVQNQGYAAGRAAATAAQTGSAIRDVDVKALQNHLVDIEVLEPDVPDHTDSFPLPEAEIQAAVSQGARSYFQLALIFGHPEKSVPYLREAYRSADSTEDKTHFARILGLLGEDEGIDTLIQVLSSRDWDEGWQFTGMGQFGFSLSDVDTLLIAAGRTKNPKAIPAMVEKLRSLSAGAEFSHMRAITLAFEEQPTEEAAPHFARLLRDERLRDASRESAAEAISEVSNDKNDTAERNRQLTELLLARGLYACGDFEGLARSVLEAYSRDFHGHYARHARAILSS